MNINELPEEILVRILSFVPPFDRLESALTCRRWAQTIARTPPLLRDVWLEIREFRNEEERIFATSHRQYENLRMTAAPYFNAAFWTNVGPTLRKLVIDRAGSPNVFYSILEACSNLEFLEIRKTYFFGRMSESSEFPPEMELEGIQKSTRNLRHLDLHCRLGADTLEYLFILMPNVSSVGLFDVDWESDIFSRLSDILGTRRRITRLYLNEVFGFDTCEQLLKISSASLTDLSYHGRIPAPTVLDALRNCSLLRDLSLNIESEQSDDPRVLLSILRNFPELESLSIWSETTVSFRLEDVMPIFDLRNLRKLNLHVRLETGSRPYVPDEIVGGLSRMISLETLRPKAWSGVYDSTRFRSFAGMLNLQELELHVEWDAECLRIVLFDLKKLRKLDLLGYPVGDGMRDRHSELEGNTLTPQDSSRSDPQGERKFSSLEVLKMHDIPLTDACLGLIAAHHNRLRIVHFIDCNGITDAGLLTLFQGEPFLKELEIWSADNLDGLFLGSLGELCPRLRSLALFDCRNLSSLAVKKLKSRRPDIRCQFW